jgi:hypothetical protein
MESNASQGVDNRTCESKNFIYSWDLIKIFWFTDDSSSFNFTRILNDTKSNRKIDEDKGKLFSLIIEFNKCNSCFLLLFRNNF